MTHQAASVGCKTERELPHTVSDCLTNTLTKQIAALDDSMGCVGELFLVEKEVLPVVFVCLTDMLANQVAGRFSVRGENAGRTCLRQFYAAQLYLTV